MWVHFHSCRHACLSVTQHRLENTHIFRKQEFDVWSLANDDDKSYLLDRSAYAWDWGWNPRSRNIQWTWRLGMFIASEQLAELISICALVCVFACFNFTSKQLKPQEVVQSLRGPFSLLMLPAGPGKWLSSLSPSPTCVSILPCFISESHTQRSTHTHGA